ncbi:MAG: tetratricopeptide repeat protein [Bacteroidota bacterium]|nr:tetratricopeptide repeat protein [Bacteroidota bacterium]
MIEVILKVIFIPATVFSIMKDLKHFRFLLIAVIFASIGRQPLHAQALQGKALADSLLHELPKITNDTDQVTLIIKVVKALISTDPPAAMHYADTALALAQKQQWKKGIGIAYVSKAKIYKATSDNVASMENANKAYEIFSSINWKPGMGDALSITANNYESLSNYSKAIENNYKALSIYEQAGLEANIAWIYNNIGANYYGLMNYPKAIENYNKALVLQKKLNDKFGIGSALDNLASVYEDQGDFTKVNEYNLQAIKLFEEINDGPGLGRIYNNRGNFLMERKEFDSAMIFFNRGIAIATKLGIKSTLAYGKGGIGDIYLNLAKNRLQQYNIPRSLKMSKPMLLEKAYEYYSQALSLSEKAGNLTLMMRFTNSLSETVALQGNYKAALSFYHRSVQYKDSVFNEENERKIAALEKERLAEVKDKEIQLLNKEKALQASELEKKDAEARRVRNSQLFIISALGIVVLAVVIIALIQFRNNRHRQKTNVLLQQQKEKVESTLSELKAAQAQLIQSEKMASLGELTAGIAHEIQNPLNFVNNFSEMNTELIAEIKNELIANNKEEAISIANNIEENAQKIIFHGKRADAIVKGMLQHSRISTGQKELTNINNLADEYLRLSYQGMRAKDPKNSLNKSFNTTLQTDFDKDLSTAGGKINIVAPDIGRVLLNLFNNAFYAVQEKEKNSQSLTNVPGQAPGNNAYEPIVTVTTRVAKSMPGGGVIISVKDNGNGIPEKVLNKIFQPFFTTKPAGQGTGLGLSLSYDIIKAHGGELKVKTQQGAGTEFIIELPV